MRKNSCRAQSAARPTAAFTLIELLVVIAIIAILAAILFPVFAQARAKARQAACLSNMKQIAIGLMMYAQDYDGYMPPSQVSLNADGVSAPLLSWPTMMYPYIKNSDVFACPDAATALGSVNYLATAANYCGTTSSTYTPNTFNQDGDGSTLGYGLVKRLSYGRNLIPTGGWQTTGYTGGDKSGFVTTGTTLSVSDSQVEDPAGTIHIMDAMTTQCYQGNSIRGIQQEIRTDHYNNVTASKVAKRHSEGFVVLYGDGHAKWLRYGSTTAANWSIQQD